MHASSQTTHSPWVRIAAVDWLDRPLGWALLALTFAAFSLFVATGFWVGVAAIIGLGALIAFLLWNYRLLVILWLVGAPTFFIFPNALLRQGSLVTVERVLFVVIAGVLLLRILVKRNDGVGLEPIGKAMLAFLAAVLLSILIGLSGKSPDMLRQDLIFYLQGVIMPFTAFFIARTLKWDERGLNTLLVGMIIAGLFLSLSGHLQVLFRSEVLAPSYEKISLDHADRARGTFGNAAEFGAVVAVILMLALYLFVRSTDALKRALLLGVLAALLSAIVLAKTRAVWLSTVIALFIVYFADKRSRPLVGGLAFCGLAGAVVVLPFLAHSELAAAISKRAIDWIPIFNRLALYATTVNMIAHNPIIGVGFGRSEFSLAKAEYYTGFGDISAQWGSQVSVPHNDFLYVLALTGLVGFIPYVLIYIRAARMLRVENAGSLPRGEPVRELRPYIAAALAIVLVNGMFADLFYFPYLLTLLYFLLGLYASPVPTGAGRSPPR